MSSVLFNQSDLIYNEVHKSGYMIVYKQRGFGKEGRKIKEEIRSDFINLLKQQTYKKQKLPYSLIYCELYIILYLVESSHNSSLTL